MIKKLVSLYRQAFIKKFKGRKNCLKPLVFMDDSVLESRQMLTLAVSEFPLQPIENGSRYIRNLTSDKTNNLWFMESITIMDSEYGDTFTKIGKLSSAGQLTEFPIPFTEDHNFQESFVAAPDGNIWFIDSPDYFSDSSSISSIVRFSHDGVVTKFKLPTGSSASSLIVGPHLNIWFSVSDAANQDNSGNNAGKIGRITPEGQIKIFQIPNSIAINGIAKGVDGRIWFTSDKQKPDGSEVRHMIGTITTGGHVEQRLLDRTYLSTGSIAVGPDGTVYFQESKSTKPDRYDFSDGIGRISPGGAISTIATIGTYGLKLGPDGNLWSTGSFDMGFGPTYVNRTTPSGNTSNFSSIGSRSFAFMGKGPSGSLWFVKSGNENVICKVSDLYQLTGALETRGHSVHDYSGGWNDWRQFDNTSIQSHPRFVGIAHPGKTVSLYAQAVGGGASVFLGATKASRINGQWAIRSKPELKDGSYVMRASESGSGQAPALLSPFSDDSYAGYSDSPETMTLKVDTKAPKLTGVKLDFAHRQFKLIVNAGEDWLLQSPIDGNIRLTRPGQIKPISISEHYAYDPSAIPEPVSSTKILTYDFIDKKPMPKGGYRLQVMKSAMTDPSGNPLAKGIRIRLR